MSAQKAINAATISTVRMICAESKHGAAMAQKRKATFFGAQTSRF
jgi:hypothetical protein